MSSLLSDLAALNSATARTRMREAQDQMPITGNSFLQMTPSYNGVIVDDWSGAGWRLGRLFSPGVIFGLAVVGGAFFLGRRSRRG